MGSRVRVLFAIALLVVLWSAVPDQSEAVEGWISGIRITAAAVAVDSYVIDTDAPTLSSCGMPSRIIIKTDVPLSRAMYATALSALLSGNKIAVNIPDDSDCHQQGVVVNVLAINLF